MRQSAIMYSAQQGHTVFAELWKEAKAWLIAGHRLQISVKPAKRSLSQNDIFHALCSRMDGQTWANKPRDAAAWKVLFISGHAVATKEGAEMVPGLEGEFVNVRESSAQMDKARASSLIEYTMAFAAQRGVYLQAEEATA